MRLRRYARDDADPRRRRRSRCPRRRLILFTGDE